MNSAPDDAFKQGARAAKIPRASRTVERTMERCIHRHERFSSTTWNWVWELGPGKPVQAGPMARNSVRAVTMMSACWSIPPNR
jgi:hypothetical protein